MGDTWVGGFESGMGWALDMAEDCSLCEGLGLRMVLEKGEQVARPCECRIQRRVARLLERARIPERFQGSSLDAYNITLPTTDESVKRALVTAKSFAKGYPVETEGRGLLFVGSKGLGKTYLAVSILKTLITERGASGVFWEHKELMESLRGAMFGSPVAGAEDALLRSLTKCDVLVLDDLGDLTPSDWTWDTTSYILNSRYNENLSTIITTNLDNRATLSRKAEPYDRFADVRKAAARLTLGDRIGDRMWSRLQEMCVIVEMHGEDYRQKQKRASFASDNTGVAAPALQSAAEAVQAALETLRLAAESEVPSFSKAVQSGGEIGSMPRAIRIGERPIATPAPEPEDTVMGRLGALAAKKRAQAAAELGIDAEKNDPHYGMVWQNGEWEPKITGGEREDERDAAKPEPVQEKPVLGRNRMGKNKQEPRDVKFS
jgi:DNA replication protein DnaC